MTKGIRMMRTCGRNVAVLAATLAAVPAGAATYWRRPAAVSGFEGVRQELRRLVEAEGHARKNRLCAVVEDVHEPPSASSEGDSRQLIVIWPEGRRIYSYGPADDGRIGPGNRDEGADIDLRRDVVASEKQIAGSTTRVTRSFVNGLIAHCQAAGTRYTIVRNSR